LVLCVSAFAVDKPVQRGVAGLANSDELLLPATYRNWVVLSPSAAGMPQHKHKHVVSKLYVEPWSYEQFTKTGAWPNKTVIVMELLNTKSPAKGSAGLMGLEAAVKNDSQFPNPWTYYGIVYDREQPRAKAAETDCKDREDPLDSMLTMAFPTLRAVINGKPASVSPSLF
jgi:hypothetical protein